MTIFIPPIVTRAQDVAAAIAETTRGAGKPVLATFFGASGVPDILAPVPCYAFPESAARALAHAVKYAQWRSAPAGQVPAMQNFDQDSARRIVARSRFTTDGWLEPLAVTAVLESCGIHAAPTRVVVDAQGALAAAHQLGFPVVLKGVGPTLLHKSEAHAVFTGLRSVEDVLRAYHALARRPDVENVLVQPMVKDGVEMFVGATLDPTFGHIVMCGSGGTLVELLHDTSCRLAPITDRAAREMIDETRGQCAYSAGSGVRSPRTRRPFAMYCCEPLRWSTACPEIAELDLNPVIVTAAGAVVVDARIRVAAAHGSSHAAA